MSCETASFSSSFSGWEFYDTRFFSQLFENRLTALTFDFSSGDLYIWECLGCWGVGAGGVFEEVCSVSTNFSTKFDDTSSK